jgi:hypothetical protein
MSPILDASGQPLPSVTPTREVDILAKFCETLDADKGWFKAGKRYEELLASLESAVPIMHGLLSGRAQLDARTPDGQALIRTVFDAVFMSLVFRRRAQEDQLAEDLKVAHNGGTAATNERAPHG